MGTAQSVFRSGLFTGKTIVVSGGGTGIGRAIARELASLGATVIICSRSAEHLEPTRAEIEASGGRAIALTCNIRDADDGRGVLGQRDRARRPSRRAGQQRWRPVHQPSGDDLAEWLAGGH